MVEYIRGVDNHFWLKISKRLRRSNHFDHITRNEEEYERSAAKILENPQHWDEDKENTIESA